MQSEQPSNSGGSVETTMAQVGNLVDMVLKLPEIQRGYVWSRPQVRDLLDSLYRGYPVGTVLLWQAEDTPPTRDLATRAEAADATLTGGQYLLDGQQRLTSLKRVFIDGEPDIRFNVETEEFQVANATIRRDTTRWIPVTSVFTNGPIAAALKYNLTERSDAQILLERLNRLDGIRKYLVPVHVLKAFDYEEVTDIFVRVNSKGTRLREAELAIARLAFRLPGMVTDDLGAFEDELDSRNYDIELRFLVRCLTAVATGQSRYSRLTATSEDDLKKAWKKTRKAVEHFVNLINNNLGIESSDWLSSINAIVVPVAYLAHNEGRNADTRGLLRWFVLSSMWQRYAGSVETTLDQDLKVLSEKNPFQLLIHDLRQSIGRLSVSAEDLDDAGVRSPFFLGMYLACRQQEAVDWWYDVKLSSTNLGTDHSLELHHVFPRALVRGKFPRRDVNELANMAFLSKKPNISIGKREPSAYLPEIAPKRLKSQFVPLDPSLWEVDRFQDFLAARRGLLAEGINGFLRSLD